MPAKVESTPALPGLSPVCGKPIIARFNGGKLSSDGGVLALREIETRLSITNRLAACVGDASRSGPRNRAPHVAGWLRSHRTRPGRSRPGSGPCRPR